VPRVREAAGLPGERGRALEPAEGQDRVHRSADHPPANRAPAGIEAAIAAPGAMSVTPWKVTSRSPIAFRRSPASLGVLADVAIAPLEADGVIVTQIVPCRMLRI
jgi:hypothetical protein